MSLDVTGLFDQVVSAVMATGLFARVNAHEPKSAPGGGLTAAVWVDNIAPAVDQSGLAVTTGRVILKIRIYTSMLAEPQDAIDPTILSAVDYLMGVYSGDFTLGGIARNIDLMGALGVPLDAQAGYINIDGKLMRIMDITLPIIVNDLWVQTP